VTQRQARTLIVLLAVILLILSGWAIRATYYVSMPLALAFFVAVLVWPLQEGVRRRLPERAGWLATVFTMLTVILGVVTFLGGAALIVWRVAASEGEQFVEQWTSFHEAVSDWLRAQGLPAPPEGQAGALFEAAVQWAGTAAAGLAGGSAILVLFVFFVLLMLVEARHWQAKARVALSAANAGDLMDALTAITEQVRTFIAVQALVSFATAVVTAVWLWVMGVPFVLLWSLLTFLLDFIPNIGPTIAGLLVTLVALVTLGWEWALITAVGVLAIQNVFGNYIGPALHGRRLAISPLVVLLSVAFWAWIWGPVGAVIAVPITATLIVVCAHVDVLRPIALMLSRTADVEKLDEQTRSG
jgi:AI-2 transport protein TqsA